MKVSSISGYRLEVNDLDKTADFYNKLGFRFGRREDNLLVVYVNWFSVEFFAGTKKVILGEGVSFLISVSNIDEFFLEAKAAKLKPLSEPESTTNGRREFSMLDPDGYKLVFFSKK